MKNKFSCPNCNSRQPLKRLWTLSKASSWKCSTCNHSIKPKNLAKHPALSGLIGALAVILPSLYSIYFLDFTFLKTMALGLSTGVIALLILLTFTYWTTKFEEM